MVISKREMTPNAGAITQPPGAQESIDWGQRWRQCIRSDIHSLIIITRLIEPLMTRSRVRAQRRWMSARVPIAVPMVEMVVVHVVAIARQSHCAGGQH